MSVPTGPRGPSVSLQTLGANGPRGPAGTTGPAGPNLTNTRDTAVSIELDYTGTARKVLELLGIRPGDKLMIERNGEFIPLPCTILDEEAAAEVIEE